jgi:hypothetical protein
MTLHDLFAPAIARQLSGPGGTAKIDALAKRMASVIDDKRVNAAAAVHAMLKKLSAVLHIEVSTILGAVWIQSDFLSSYLDKETLGLAEAIDVAAGEHAIESAHQPSMDIVVNGKSVSTVSMDIDLALTLESVVLNIESWTLTGIVPGAGTASGTISCLGITLVEKEVEPLELPTGTRFPLNLRIGPSRGLQAEATARSKGPGE